MFPKETAAVESDVIKRSMGSSIQQISHNNYIIHPKHVLQNRGTQQLDEATMPSAKIIIQLVTGEQLLVTFFLPRKPFTLHEFLDQVGVKFAKDAKVQCIENPGGNTDFIVTVGLSGQKSASVLIAHAEASLQTYIQQQQQ